MIVSDEVYEHMVYDGARHESLARHDELAARSVVIGSFGKTFHATGWKVGYTLAPPEITAEIRRVHQFTVFTVNSAMQHGLAGFLGDPARYESLPAFFTAKRDLLRSALAGTPFDLLPCRGSYFQLATYARVSAEPAADFAQRLVRGFRRGDHSAVGFLPRWHRSPRDPLLFRQTRRDDSCRSSAPAAPRDLTLAAAGSSQWLN